MQTSAPRDTPSDHLARCVADQLLLPTWPLKVRIYGCLVRQALLTNTELAAVVHRGKYGWDKPKLLPMTSSQIIEVLNESAVLALSRTGVELPEDERAKLRHTVPIIRRCLAEMEREGMVTRVKIESEAEDLHQFTLDDALSRNLVKRLSELPNEERKKLSNGRTAIYLSTEASADRTRAAAEPEKPEAAA